MGQDNGRTSSGDARGCPVCCWGDWRIESPRIDGDQEKNLVIGGRPDRFLKPVRSGWRYLLEIQGDVRVVVGVEVGRLANRPRCCVLFFVVKIALWALTM
jgi:hypothetical protein